MSRTARDAANSLPRSGPQPTRDNAARIDVRPMPAFRRPPRRGDSIAAGAQAASSARGPLIAAFAAAMKSLRSSSVHAAVFMTVSNRRGASTSTSLSSRP